MVVDLSSDIIRYLEKHRLLLTVGHYVDAKQKLIAEKTLRKYGRSTHAAQLYSYLNDEC
jgi:hypothetical protein